MAIQWKPAPSLQAVARGDAVLRKGMRGPSVGVLQKVLNQHGGELDRDKAFGDDTEAAVRRYQRNRRRLGIDGAVGKNTLLALTDSPRGAADRKDEHQPAGGPDRRARGFVRGRAHQIMLSHVENGRWLRRDAATAFRRMARAAKKDGVDLELKSAFRTMHDQEARYARYVTGRGNLAARPGHSNHQGGIAADIQTRDKHDGSAAKWLRANALRFGFRNTVPSEPWHWEYRP